MPNLTNLWKRGADVVAQGLELKPVTGPVKNITGPMLMIFVILLIGAKLITDLAASATLKQIAVGGITVSVSLFVAVLLLQWNRSLLWHRALRGQKPETSTQSDR